MLKTAFGGAIGVKLKIGDLVEWGQLSYQDEPERATESFQGVLLEMMVSNQAIS